MSYPSSDWWLVVSSVLLLLTVLHKHACIRHLIFVTQLKVCLKAFVSRLWSQKPAQVCQTKGFNIGNWMKRYWKEQGGGICKSERKGRMILRDQTLLMPQGWKSLNPPAAALLGVVFRYITDLLRWAALTRPGLLKGVISAVLEVETAWPRYFSTCSCQKLPGPASFWEPEA